MKLNIDELRWFTSSFSSANGACVECAPLPDGLGVAVRDSKNPGGGVLVFSAQAWREALRRHAGQV